MSTQEAPKAIELLSTRESLPTCERAEEFLGLLRSTEEYQARVNQRLESALQFTSLFLLSEDESPPTYEEIATLFESVDEFERLFWDFSERVIHLRYDSNHYSERFQEAFADYRNKVVVSFMTAEIGGYPKEIVIELDRIRSLAHNQAAQILMEDGVVKTETLGRMLARALLVDVKEDYIASARQASFIRKLREAPDELAQRKLLVEAPPIQYTGFFAPERISAIQMDYIATHPEASVVLGEDYRRKPAPLIKISRMPTNA